MSTGLRYVPRVWQHAIDCSLCGVTIPPGAVGIATEHPTDRQDERRVRFVQNAAYHRVCAATHVIKLAAAAKQAAP